MGGEREKKEKNCSWLWLAQLQCSEWAEDVQGSSSPLVLPGVQRGLAGGELPVAAAAVPVGMGQDCPCYRPGSREAKAEQAPDQRHPVNETFSETGISI